jgi:polyisoprenyl-teichoic acid--peptidoglycan teichoic acid transferase
MSEEDVHTFPRRGALGIWLRFLAAAALVVGLTAATTATAGLLNVQSFVDDLKAGGTIENVDGVITRADAGAPRTLLLIGSDHRYGDPGTAAHSDTMMLVRIDPDAAATTVLSIPRDLRVTFRTSDGRLHADTKLNQTYTLGGEALTAEVIRRTFGLEINNIANINFAGFREAIDAIGCVYVDVDRRYYHSNDGVPAGDQYAEIDIMPGYQLMCGARALDYVRYRHTDNDLVRGARQQDFLRQIRSQYDANDFIDDPHKLTKVIGRRMQTDTSLQSIDALIELGKQIAFSAKNPIEQVQIRPDFTTGAGGAAFVEIPPREIARVTEQFLHPAAGPPAATSSAARPARAGGRGGARGGRAARPGRGDGLFDMGETGKQYAMQLGFVRMPVYYPRLIPNPSGYVQPNGGGIGGYPYAYRIRTPDGRMRPAYRLVVDVGGDAYPGNYMGVQGLAWTDPPILKNPSSDHRTIDGKKLDLYYDGTRLRLVAWRTPQAVYWISNTLQTMLSNDQMLAIAGSLTRLGR